MSERPYHGATSRSPDEELFKPTQQILNDEQTNSVCAKTSDSDEERLKATQQIENNTVKGRFSKPLTEEEYYDYENW